MAYTRDLIIAAVVPGRVSHINCLTRAGLISPQARNTEYNVCLDVGRSFLTAFGLSSYICSMILPSGLWTGHIILRLLCCQQPGVYGVKRYHLEMQMGNFCPQTCCLSMVEDLTRNTSMCF